MTKVPVLTYIIAAINISLKTMNSFFSRLPCNIVGVSNCFPTAINVVLPSMTLTLHKVTYSRQRNRKNAHF